MSSNPQYKNQGPELLVDLMDKAADLMKAKGGLSQEKAEELAIALSDSMAESWGGSMIYFPKGTWNGNALRCFQLADRDWQIYREYNGKNHQELCARHAISSQRLYQIIAACRRHLATARAQAKPTPI